MKNLGEYWGCFLESEILAGAALGRASLVALTCYISAPVAKEHIQKKTQNKVKYAKGLKKGMMCYERWTGAVYCWLTYAEKPSHK